MYLPHIRFSDPPLAGDTFENQSLSVGNPGFHLLIENPRTRGILSSAFWSEATASTCAHVNCGVSDPSY
jgi:hypothetical protein